ncbi:hypothetical protein [Suttonella ornithocola]|uniref:Uncharacterized protein n=1 Tax=Suttonella ornithocola TaxID=279832 RepID=A0A380MM89_9GAMM|nr:hypothetical protein [Suttonella ornithocola]SUO93720.1 Uncharacterised protein [Suttonella ornithocola]
MSVLNNKFLSDYVALAEASYADYSEVLNSSSGEKKDFKTKMMESDKDGGAKMVEPLATEVAKHYEVVAHWKDRTDESSFSGTL